MNRKVVGAVCFGVVAMVAVVTSPQLLDVVWGVAVVVVVVVQGNSRSIVAVARVAVVWCDYCSVASCTVVLFIVVCYTVV